MSPTEPEEKMSEQNKPEQPEQKDAEQATSEQGQGVPETSEPDQVNPVPGEYELEETIDEAGHNSYSQGALVRRRFLHHKGAMAASIILLLVIVLAFSSSLWWPKNHVDLYPLAKANGAPTFQLWPFSLGENPFGQNTIGKDYFALVMQGTQKSVIIAFVVGFIATAIGTVVGSAAGYFRGRVSPHAGHRPRDHHPTACIGRCVGAHGRRCEHLHPGRSAGARGVDRDGTPGAWRGALVAGT